MAEPGVPLSSRTVLVTGAGNGVGRAAAELAARRGATVLCTDRDAQALGETTSHLQSIGLATLSAQADITDENEIRSVIASLVEQAGGALHSVLHVAGIMRAQRLSLEEITLDIWNEVITTNLTGAFLVAKHSVEFLRRSVDSSLVLVASRSGIVVPSGSLPYGASKGGIHGFAMSLDKQLNSSGIRVHTLCPGDVDTPLMRASLDEALRNGADPADVERIRASLGTAESIASALVHLIDPAARGISGTVLAGQ